MNYLLYVEHAAENLQFFLWYRDYVERFNDADTSDINLSPEWTQAMEDETAAKIQKDAIDKLRKGPKTTITIFKGTDFEKGVADVTVVEKRNPFSTPPPTPSVNDASSFLSGPQVSGYRTHIQDAFSAAGTTQPCTFTPYYFCPYLPISYKTVKSVVLTLASHHPALPRRNQPHNHNVHHDRLAATTEPLVAAAKTRSPGPGIHDAPLRLALRGPRRRGHVTTTSAPEFHPVVRVQRQPAARALCQGARRRDPRVEHCGCGGDGVK